jgi:hypothetical protein
VTRPARTASAAPRRSARLTEVVERIEAANIRRTVDALAAFHTRHVGSGEANIGAAARYLFEEFDRASQSGGRRLRVAFDTFETEVSRLGGRTLAMTNVVAELPGETTPERVIVVGGHYDSRATDPADADSRAPGANDNASGTAVALELARVLAGERWPCTLVFIAFSGEEMGLLGARHWASRARAAGRDVIAMLNNDMVGNTTDASGASADDRVRVFSEGVPRTADALEVRRFGIESDSPSRQLARYAFEIAPRYVADLAVDLAMRPDRLGRGGDHLPFNEQGYPAIRFVEALEQYDRQHQDVRVEDGRSFGDLPDFVDADYAARIARLNCAVIASLALAPPPPSDVVIERPVSHEPNVVWTPVEGASVGYVVRMRRTDAPAWEHRIEVGRETSFALTASEVSDCFIAVQAVDREGHESLPVVALPRLQRPAWA